MKKEKILVAIISITFVILVNLPLIYFYLIPNGEMAFLGRRVINFQDTYTYVSFIEQAKQGKLLFENQYTTEPQTDSLLRPSYLVLGKIASITNTQSITIFNFSRVVLCVVFLYVLYKFISWFFDKSDKKIYTYAVVLFSSGLGFLSFFSRFESTDQWIPESNTFLSMAEAPHFIFSQILMLAGFMLFILFLEKKNLRFLAFSVFAFLMLSLEHPYNIFVAAPVVFILSILSKRSIKQSMLYALICSIGICYQLFVSLTNPAFKLWQNATLLSPSAIQYILGLGLILLLGIIGAEKVIKKNELKYKLLLIWVAITAILIYSPVVFQRRLIEGIHIPLAILAVFGIFEIISHLKKKFRSYGLILIFLALVPTQIYLTYIDFTNIKKDTSQAYYYHLKKTEMTALTWLKNNSSKDSVVLSNWFYGNLIPGLTGRKVYIGHRYQTKDFTEKISNVNSFLLSNDIFSSIRFLKDNNIDYIFLGVDDPMITYGFTPDSKPFLKKIYNKAGVLIYEIDKKYYKLTSTETKLHPKSLSPR